MHTIEDLFFITNEFIKEHKSKNHFSSMTAYKREVKSYFILFIEENLKETLG